MSRTNTRSDGPGDALARFMTPDELASVRRANEAGCWLPPRCYTDPDFYELEKERVFRRSWLAVGRVDQVAEPGDYFSLDLFGEPIIVCRDRGGDLRALSNVCTHRWMRLVGHPPDARFPFKADACGHRNSFQCPYHLWSFDLDGRLVGAPGMEEAEGFDKADHGLPRFAVETWGGFVFVNLDPEAAPLASQLRALDPFVEAYELDRLRMIEGLEYDCPWNWKLSVEAGNESYHHLGLHQDILEEWLPAEMSDIEPSMGPFTIYRNPTKDGSPMPCLFPPPRGLDERQMSSLQLVNVFPYTMFFMSPEHTAWLQLIPESAESHKLVYVPLMHPNVDQAERPDEVGAVVRAMLDAVHQQDMAAGPSCQVGAASRAARAGRRSHLESQAWQWHSWLLDRLEAG